MDGLLERFGHMSPLEALPIMLLLTAYQGLEFAILSWGVYRLRERTSGRSPIALDGDARHGGHRALHAADLPLLPGDLAGLVPALIQIADLTGPIGVTALMVAWNGALARRVVRAARGGGGSAARCARSPSRRRSSSSTLVYGAVRLHQVDAARAAAPKVKTGLVQANVGILEKWDPAEFAKLLVTHQRALGRAHVARAPSSSSGPSRPTRTRCRARSSTSGPPTIRGACAPASTRRCCSARSRAPSARRSGPPIATPTTRRS